VVEGGGGSYSIAGAFDGSRDFLAIKQSGLEDFFVPDISAVSFDSNLDADPDDNGVGGNDPIPTNWQYDVGTPEINFPLNFYATVDGSLRFGFIPTKSGCKFNDLDGDGEWDEGELGIPDWPIFISDLATGELVAETTTGPDGCYAFNVPLGAYAVCEGELFPNFVQTAPVSGLDCDGDPDYPGTGIGYVVNLTVENPIHEGNDFGNREEFVPGKCRMTGGSVTENLFEDANGVLRVAYEYVDGTFVQVNGNGNGKGKCTGDYCVTTGGQIGAPSVDPATGHWAHTQHGGAEGNFTFLSGTASAPPGTEISEIDCADEGWCVQARCAPFKQIFWDGVGYFPERHGGVTFDAVFPLCDNVSTDKPPARNSSLHYYRAMVGDFGDNKKPVRDDPVTSTESTCTWDELLPGGGPPGPYDVGSAVILPSTPYPDEPFLSKGGQECDKCPDYYQIEIYCYACDPFEGDPDCVLGVDNEPMYEFAVFIDNGNFQIHPETGDQCVAIPELFPALFDDTSGDGTSGGGKGKGKNK
jgi:hypothetical protein